MAKNHTARKQLCGSVQNSTNNITTGKSIKANASRSTATATLALLDIVNWTGSYHKVHWKQLILVDTFRLNFSKNHWGKEMLCLTPFQKFGNHLEPTKSACRKRYWSFIANEGMQSHWEGSPNFIAWTHKKKLVTYQGQGNWSHALSASRKIERRHFLYETHFFRKGNNWMGNSNRIYFQSIPLTLLVENPKVSLFKSAITRKVELKRRFKKKENLYSKKKFRIASFIRVGIKGVLENSAAKITYKRSASNLENRAARFQKFDITRLTCEKSQHLKFPEF